MRTQPLMESLEPRLLLDGDDPAPPVERIIDFAGMQWAVESVAEPANVGDNWFSDSEASVWVDLDGLHLKLRADGGTWYGAQVVTTQATTYGQHRFYVTGRPDLFDANIRLDLSLVGQTTAAGIQLGGSPNGRYAVDAATDTFAVLLNGQASTYSIDWHEGDAAFSSHHWHTAEPETPAHVIHSWDYAGPEVPALADDVRVRMLLSLDYALPPTDGAEVEIVIAAADVPNHVPVADSVVCDPNWLIAGELLTAVAAGVADSDGQIAQVAFYLDANGDGIGQVEESLGIDADGSDGWSWTGAASWDAGVHGILARPTDDDGTAGGWVFGDVIVAEAPEIFATIGIGDGSQGRSITFTDADGSIVTISLNAGLATLGFTQPTVQLLSGPDGIVLTGGVRLVTVTLSDTTTRSNLIFKVRGGLDKRLEVGRIVGDRPLGRLAAGQVDLIGSGVALTGDGYVGGLTVGNLLNGADIRMEGRAKSRGVAVTAAIVGPGSVIDIVGGPIRNMKFTGEFHGVVAAGVDAGPDGLYFTGDDFVTRTMKVGPIRINRPAVGLEDQSFGVLTGPKGAKVIVPKAYRTLAAAGTFETRVLPGPDAGINILRATGKASARVVVGRVADVAISRYRVDLYVETDGVLTLVRSVNPNRRGMWTVRKVGAGELRAYLVSRDLVAADVLAEPLTADGFTIVAETIHPPRPT